MTKQLNIKPFMNDEGLIKEWPGKKAKQIAVLEYICKSFDVGIEYEEKDVNAIIDKWHTFGDYFLLRREMIDEGLLCRTNNGSKYWKEEK